MIPASATTDMGARPAGLADALRSHPHPGGIIVHPEKRFIYMKSCKTAGTSIFRKLLEPQLGGFIHQRGNKPAYRQWITTVTDADLADYYIFSSVRNPWNRFQSLCGHFKLPVPEVLDRIEELRAADRNFRFHAVPQIHYTHVNGQAFCNRLARVEALQDDMNAILSDLKMESVTVPRANANPNRPDRAVLSKEEAQRIAALYPDDVAAYGYEFSETAPA